MNPPSIDPHYFFAKVKSLGVLGPYWGEKLGKVSMRAFQGWGSHVGGCERNSVLYLERKGDGRICINGENKIVGKGELFS